MFPYLALWFDSGFIFMSVFRGLVCGLDCRTLRKIRGAVRRWSLIFLSCAQSDSHGPAVQQTMVLPQLQFLYEVTEVPGMQVVQVCRCVQRQVPPQLQFINKVVVFLFVAQQTHRSAPPPPLLSPSPPPPS